MAQSADPQSPVMPAVRLVGSLAAGLIIAGFGGMVLGEYTFQGEGIQWLAISGGVGIGAVIAWVLNRIWSHAPPLWMAPVAGLLAIAGETLAVQRDTEGLRAWPGEGWAAVALAGAAGAYGIYTAHRLAMEKQAKGG